jgi:hypothetical protein
MDDDHLFGDRRYSSSVIFEKPVKNGTLRAPAESIGHALQRCHTKSLTISDP